MIEIIPAIDIIGGRCVRLSQGDYNKLTTYDSRPEEIARRMADAGVGRIHVVDLDGAKSGAPVNLRSVEAIASLGVAEIELGGGLKSDSALRSAFDAKRHLRHRGSIAVKDQPTFAGWLRSFGAADHTRSRCQRWPGGHRRLARRLPAYGRRPDRPI